MKRIVIFLFVVGLFQSASGQKKGNREIEIITHKVMQGETVKMLSQRYLASPADIYKMNKGAVDGISAGMYLQIPVRKKELPAAMISNEKDDAPPVQKKSEETREESQVSEASPNAVTEHKVGSGETLSGLAKKYNISVAQLKAANEKKLKNGLQAGQTLKIPSAEGTTPMPEQTIVQETVAEPALQDGAAENQNGVIKHKVEKGETLSGLAKKYNISVDEIKRQNEKLLSHGLQSGQVIQIQGSN